jgi:hypothetical protein
MALRKTNDISQLADLLDCSWGGPLEVETVHNQV